MIYALKVLISAVVIATAAEIAKRVGPFWAAVLIAMPLTSILAMSLTYWDTRDSLLMAEFARSILIIVPVSLVFFVPFALARHTHLGFAANMALGLALLALAIALLSRFVRIA